MLNKISQRIACIPEMQEVKIDGNKFVANIKNNYSLFLLKPLQCTLKSYYGREHLYKRLKSDIYDYEYEEKRNENNPIKLTNELMFKNWRLLIKEHLIYLNHIYKSNIDCLENENNFQDDLDLFVHKIRMETVKETIDFLESL
jgi:hypothetical protein